MKAVQQDQDGLRWTRLYLGGLKMGLSTEDLRTMPIGRLMWMAEAMNGSNERSRSDSHVSDGEAREATQADIKSFLC